MNQPHRFMTGENSETDDDFLTDAQFPLKTWEWFDGSTGED